MVNRNYKKGGGFEYEWMYYLIYHYFDNVRSYASKGVADVRSVPPKEAKSPLVIYAQCKNTKKGDYIDPKERRQLRECQEKFQCIVIEPFKKDRECFVKIEPYKLDGEIMKPEVFLKKYYGINADSWKEWRNNWFREGIKRQPINNN